MKVNFIVNIALTFLLFKFYLFVVLPSVQQPGSYYSSLQIEETSASASNHQLSNMKCPARDSNQRPQRLEARTLTPTPPSSLLFIHILKLYANNHNGGRF